MTSHATDSPFWKALTGVWQEFQNQVIWKVEDGNTINFWLDKWVPNKGALINAIIDESIIIDTTLSLLDMVTPSGGWNVETLKQALPLNIVSKITTIPPPMEEDGLDRIGWKGTINTFFYD